MNVLALNPFDLKAALVAKHAQHVVLIHFPIALYLSGTLFDLCARMLRKSGLAEVARWNFLLAVVMSIPTAATGLLAWQRALEGKHLKGLLLLHLLFACATVVGLWLTVWLRSRRKVRREGATALPLAHIGGVFERCESRTVDWVQTGSLDRRQYYP